MKILKKKISNKIVLSAVCFLLIETQVLSQNIPQPGNTVTAGTATVNTRPSAYSPSAPVNLVREWVAQKPYTDITSFFLDNADITKVQHSTSYSDGLGRSLQSVNWKASPSGTDMVSAIMYDGFGREQFQYLPYTSPGNDGNFKSDPFGEQNTFYSSYLTDQPTESYYYGHTNFEASPLNRITSTFAPGNSWAGSEGSSSPKSKNIQYLINSGSGIGKDNVQQWTISFAPLTYSNEDASTNVPSASQIYPTGSLMKTVATDENGKATVEYTDILGHVVLKKVQLDGTITSDYSGYTGFLCTYYVYDDLGLLRFTITPKAVLALIANGFSLTSDMINELCFRYEYDARQRLIAKRTPGAGWTFMVYDQMDRIVFTQDANLRKSNQWLETLYDNVNRVVETGILTYSGIPTALQINNTQTGTTITGNNLPSIQTNLYLDNRQLNVPSYKASNSIIFSTGFSSEVNAAFSTQLIISDVQPFSNTVTTTADPMPLNCLGCSFVALSITNYDSYNTGKNFINYSGNLDQGTNAYSDPSPSVKTLLTYGLVTSTKVKVIENPGNLAQGGWLESTVYYDDKGRGIQIQEDNYKGGIDIQTNLYDFTSRLLCTYEVHNNASGNISAFSLKTNMNYDVAGRLLNVMKRINGSSVQTKVSDYSYDALGNLKGKRVGVNQNNVPLENDVYNYNIRGQLKGINWNYGSNPTSPNVDIQNSKWFALDLSYDWGYSTNQFNGNIAGQKWMNGSDRNQRSYGYKYDAANQLLTADFSQNFGGSWVNTDPSTSNTPLTIDYTVKMGDGINTGSAYDVNGNIKQMQQNGLILNASSLIDNLSYNYLKVLSGAENSAGIETNKLAYVNDAATQPSVNLGDFNKKHTGGGNDYGYDNAGNLVSDLNKIMNGPVGYNQGNGAIVYNFLELPSQITIFDASNNPTQTIIYIYDAAGNKLEKRITDIPTSHQTITSYLGNFVYQNNVLQFFGTEEGRVRFTNNTTTPFVYDYFIQDHLGSTRVVLTDEQRMDGYVPATLEDATLTNEQKYYSILTSSRALTSSITNYPVTSGNSYTQKLLATGSTPAIGTSMILKVMAGDMVNVKVDCWYKTSGPLSPISNPGLTGIITSLASATTGVPAASGGKFIAPELTSATLTPDVTAFLNSRNGSSYISGQPKAFLNVVLLDEQMRPVLTTDGNNSYFQQVPIENNFNTNGSTTNSYPNNKVYSLMMPPNRLMTKSGYLYIYVSNEDINTNVYFDNLQVSQVRGPLLETGDYYPYGLKMAGISSNASPVMTDKYQYQGDNSEFESLTGYNEFDLRHYDAQLGRWVSSDPKGQFASPYSGMANNPVSNIDKDGAWSFGLTGAILGAALGATASYFIVKNNPHMDWEFKSLLRTGLPLLGAGLGYGLFESLYPGTEGVDDWINTNNRFGGNVRAFYKGLFRGGVADLSSDANKVGTMSRYGASWAEVPDLSIPKIKINIQLIRILPKWEIWNKYGNNDDNSDPTHYSLMGRQWRAILSGGMPVGGDEDGPDFEPSPWLIIQLFPLPLTRFAPIEIPIAYSLIRMVIVKPIIHIHVEPRHP